MRAVVLACAAQAVYVVAFVMFKTAARGMPPLIARRPLQTVGRVLRSRRWLAGFLILLAGFAMGDLALLTLPLATALPAYGFSLVLLLLAGSHRFGERLTPPEWAATVIAAMAMALMALSVLLEPGGILHAAPRRAAVPAVPPLWELAVVVVPSLLIPLWMFCARDRVVMGRHARPLTGVAYGIGAGALLGTAEVFGLGMALLPADRRTDVLGTPYLTLFLLAGAFGLGLMSIGLQRCRLIILVTVVTVTAKLHMLLSATLLYGEPWPDDVMLFMLRTASVLLAALAVAAYPRHERRSRRPAVPDAPGGRGGPGGSGGPVEPEKAPAYVGRRRRNTVPSL
ncbi:hypothetical protein ACFVH6_38130 [Spirillospora sp. NPDC127200]